MWFRIYRNTPEFPKIIVIPSLHITALREEEEEGEDISAAVASCKKQELLVSDSDSSPSSSVTMNPSGLSKLTSCSEDIGHHRHNLLQVNSSIAVSSFDLNLPPPSEEEPPLSLIIAELT